MKVLFRYCLWIACILSISIAVAGIAVSFYISPSFSREEKMTYKLPYFEETFDACRSQFRSIAGAQKNRVLGLVCGEIRDHSLEEGKDGIDYCLLKAESDKKLVIFSSGIHGIEGYAGSAVQAMILDKYLSDFAEEGWSVLMLHGINYQGFAANTRVTSSNCDLNRNFLLSEKEFTEARIKSDYQEYENLLSPKQKASTSLVARVLFASKAAYNILIHGKNQFRQVILGGQYSHPKGLYFGGQKREPFVKPLVAFLQSTLVQYSEIVGIDLHTGYGNRGELHLFPNETADHKVRQATEALFKGHQIDWGDGKDFYVVKGDFASFVVSLAPQGSQYIPMIFEYGTVDNLGVLGSLKSLFLMIRENQGRHFGYQTKTTEEVVKHQFKEHYYPSDPEWRNAILKKTEELIRTTFFDKQ
jgi:hypothetical protein